MEEDLGILFVGRLEDGVDCEGQEALGVWNGCPNGDCIVIVAVG